MTDSRRERALTAARIRLRSPIPRPLLDETRIDEVCAELLATEQSLFRFSEDVRANERRLCEEAITKAHVEMLTRYGQNDPASNAYDHAIRIIRERGDKAATSPETALPATIDTKGGSGHG